MDNLSINNRTRSYSFLNTVCHEKQQEVDLLNKQICVKDNIITDLKARLGRYERLYVTMGDNDSVLLGPSNSLVESLLKEICKLKQKKNDVELIIARQAEVKHAELLCFPPRFTNWF